MKFWSLFIVSWMPILEVLLIGLVASLLATSYINILPPEARKHINKELGNILIWTHCYYVMERSAKIHKRLCRESCGSSKTSEVSHHSYVVREEDKGDYETLLPPSTKVDFDEWNCKNDTCVEAETNSRRRLQKFWNNFKKSAKNVMGFLLSPPTIAGFIGLFVGAIPTLKSLVAGENAPLHVIQDSLKLLGDAAIPCTILILGGNLSKGIRKSAMKPLVVVAITAIRYVILPICGIGVVTGADKLGYLPESPLFKYVLLIQFTVPPAMSLGTIAQLFEVGEEECSVIFFWTYLIAAIALTVWSMVFMSILL